MSTMSTTRRLLLAALCAFTGLAVSAPSASAQPFMRVRNIEAKEGKPSVMVGYQLRTGEALVPTRRWKDERMVNVGGPSIEQQWKDSAEADGWIDKDTKPPLQPGEKYVAQRGRYTQTFPLSMTDFSEWIDLGKFKLNAPNPNRAGGKAEWPMIWVYYDGSRDGVAMEVQLSEKADDSAVVATFVERTSSGTIGFTLPTPLDKANIETGSQMAARQLEWAKQLVRNREPNPGRFDVWISLAGLYYDPGLIVPCVDTVRKLGANVLTGAPFTSIQEVGLKTVRNADFYLPDVDAAVVKWKEFARGPLASEFATPDGSWLKEHLAAYTIGGDGSSSVDSGGNKGLRALKLSSVDAGKVNGWYREYLKTAGVTAEQLGADPASAVYKAYTPAAATGDLATRKSVYYSARFAQFLSAKHLRSISDGIRLAVPGLRSIALISQRGLLGEGDGFGACATNLDPFLVTAQNSVQLLGATDQLSVQLGDTSFAWSGVGTYEFVQAFLRSATLDRDVRVHAQFAPGDEKAIYAKSLAAIAQGVRSFHFRDFGPTFSAKNEYWSDLPSMYDGLVRLNELIEKNEELLFAAKTVTDPVAILHSASNDIWAGSDGSDFSDMRLTWHALRHMGYQPNFVSEAQVEAGGLKNYKVLYVSSRCIAKKAAEAIGAWVNEGGTAMFSGGAGTRDEFNEPALVPGLHHLVVAANAPSTRQPGKYDERADLPAAKPLGTVVFTNPKGKFEVPALAVKMTVASPPAGGAEIAAYSDGSTAVATLATGKGTVIVSGIYAGLAYGQGAGFKPGAYDEKWPDGPRLLIKTAVDVAKVAPFTRIEPDGSGVTASLLSGAAGPVLVIVNPAQKNVPRFRVDVRAAVRPVACMSHDGARVTIRRGEGTSYAIELPLRGLSEVIVLPK